MKVVIVDDSKEFRSYLSLLLKNFTMIKSINEVASGEDFLKLLDAEIPDLVFMDYAMPGINGAQAIKKGIDIYRDLKIIGISCNEDFCCMQKMIEAGARNFLPKAKLNKETLTRILEKQ